MAKKPESKKVSNDAKYKPKMAGKASKKGKC